jgi:plastocyanin
MQTKLVLGGAVAIVVLGAIYFMSQPKEAVAPVEGTTAQNEIVTEGQNLGPVDVSTTTGTETALPDTTSVQTGEKGTAQNTPTQPNTTSAKPKPVVTNPVIPTPTPAPFIATVYYDENYNFVPETITIVQGGTVQFENMSAKPMWIGSNNHPYHDRYPVKSATDCLGSSFDQCKSVGKGGTWSYTFSELGEWRYHNHARSIDEGKVIVVTKEKYLQYVDENQ